MQWLSRGPWDWWQQRRDVDIAFRQSTVLPAVRHAAPLGSMHAAGRLQSGRWQALPSEQRRAAPPCRWRDCFADEHYMASLVAYLQLGHETDCAGFLVSVSWRGNSAHPVSYQPVEIRPELCAC